jgi:NAD(P)-dependent dehydrogenase (short-subunit alcohol dehydrogenase family)
MDIQGKTVLVAGATSGLGLAVARDFIKRGANVALVGRRAELAQEIAAELGGRAIGLAAGERFGTIDINVNTAGFIATVPLVTPEGKATQTSEFTRLMNTNVIGTFNVMSRAAAVMLTNSPSPDGERGVIINTSSDAAYDGTTGMVGYSATKAALVGMTLPAAREFAGRGIRVNASASRRSSPRSSAHRRERLLQRVQPAPRRRIPHWPVGSAACRRAPRRRSRRRVPRRSRPLRPPARGRESGRPRSRRAAG